VLDTHGVTRATIVGHSFGAAVAAWLAASYPERVGALVLVSPAANVASLYAVDRWLAAPVGGYLATATALAGAGFALSAWPVRRAIARELAIAEPYLQAVGRRLLTRDAWRSYVVEQRALIRDLPTLESRLDQISAPTVIVAGAADQIVPVAAARQLSRQIPDAELVLINRAGHLLPLQHAERLAQIIAGIHASR
jgi:pimeloyl-ACP methyl ester carboxylesterase